MSKEVAIQIAKNYSCRQPHCQLMPPPRGTPVNIRIHLIFPETSHQATFLLQVVWVIGSIFIRLAVAASQKCELAQNSVKI